MSELKRTQCPKCNAFSGDDWKQCRGSCPMTMSPHYDPTALTTPSQGLDAATVERCAQEAEKARETAISLGFVKRTGVAADRIGTVGMKIAARIRALATDPHQHGAGKT